MGSDDNLYVTWSRGMSRMSLILILSYRLKQMTYSYVLHCFQIPRIAHISWTRCRIVMGYGSKCRIWYVQVVYIENSKLNIADKWLISLDHVTYRDLREMGLVILNKFFKFVVTYYENFHFPNWREIKLYSYLTVCCLYSLIVKELKHSLSERVITVSLFTLFKWNLIHSHSNRV